MESGEGMNNNVYPIYRLDKNVSWHNLTTFIFGLIYGIITLEFLRKSEKYMLPRFIIGKLWLPPKWGEE